MSGGHTTEPTAPEAPPSLADIEAAASRLAPVAVTTPLLDSPLLDARLAAAGIGGQVLVKAEVLQRTGSFKFRGAYNRISLIPPERRSAGVVAFSSGNHAQAVAAAAKMLGMAAIIVMPSDAPAVKRAATAAWGARIVSYDRYTESREAIGAAIAAETGATLVKPYDDPGVIAGQGTLGLELAAQLAARGIRPDAVLVPASGGGLAAGTALALADRLPGVPVYAVEPAGFDDTARSLAAGAPQANDPAARSICDALMAPSPGEITFALNRRLLAGGLVVSDGEALAAMAAAFELLRIVVEPGGAVALAAALAGRVPRRDGTVVAVASGGNVDPAMFARALDRA